MATIKITAMGNVPRFNHGGISVAGNWSTIDLDSLSEEQRQTLVDYTGRFVRVHDEDADAFRSYLSQHGYEYKDGRVEDTRPEERAKERERAAQERAARSTATGRPPPPREDAAPADFQGPPGSAVATRDRDSSTTDPQRPSNKVVKPR